MLDKVAKDLRAAAGIRPVADLGVVHESMVGRARCTVVLRVEEWKGCYYLCIEVRYSGGRAFRRTRVVKLAYSYFSPTDLALVLTDLDALSVEGSFVDPRTWFGKLFDVLLRRRVFGFRQFTSSVDLLPPLLMNVELVEQHGRRHATFKEVTPGRGYILAQVPFEACQQMAAALRAYINAER